MSHKRQMIALSASGETLYDVFYLAFRNWGIWGGIATVLPIISLVLIVFRPKLWG